LADQRASKWALFSRRFFLSGPYALCEKSLEAFRIGTDSEQNDTQHHCQWCGRPFTPSLFTPLDPLLYCSSRYAFAGFFLHIGLHCNPPDGSTPLHHRLQARNYSYVSRWRSCITSLLGSSFCCLVSGVSWIQRKDLKWKTASGYSK
jgi:hypothetical protein